MKLRCFTIFLFLTSSLAILFVLQACSKSAPETAHQDGNVGYYICAMHPSVRSQDPHAKCPICSMSLVPVKKPSADKTSGTSMSDTPASNGNAEQPQVFTISLDRQQLIGVTYATAAPQSLKSIIRTAGVVAASKERRWDFVARIDGYIHELKVFAPGDVVEKDQAIMEIFSRDLEVAQNELIGLLHTREEAGRNGNASLADGANHMLADVRLRLRQWNVGAAEIEEIEASRKKKDYLAFVSPIKGVVEDISVDQGRHLMVGDHLLNLIDLSAVWVWAEFYQDDLPLLKLGLTVTISSSSLPGVILTGKIALIDPFMNDLKRTVRVRIDVENPDFKLRPGMYVDTKLSIDYGKGLTVPVSAVLPTGQHNIVFVDKGSGKLQPQFVELGGKFGDAYLITNGLNEGDRVVSSANFLIDAESKVQGALKSW